MGYKSKERGVKLKNLVIYVQQNLAKTINFLNKFVLRNGKKLDNTHKFSWTFGGLKHFDSIKKFF